MADPNDKEPRYYPAEVAALRATGYEVMSHLCERLGVTQPTLKRAMQEDKILAIPVGNIVMVKVDAAERWHKTWRAERSGTRLPTVTEPDPALIAAAEALGRDVESLRADVSNLSRKFVALEGLLAQRDASQAAVVRATGQELGQLEQQVVKLVSMVEDLLTRPVPTPPPALRATAKIDAQDIVGALLSTGGRAALVGAVGTSLDASTSRQVIREAVMSALGSAEGRAAIRAAVHESLNGYDATKGAEPYRPMAGGQRRG